MAGILSTSSKSSGRGGILVTLDAFGTLYHPREPIAVQYLKIARQCGLKANIRLPELEGSFRKAFKDQYSKHPNYGTAAHMTPERWWEDIVHGAFAPLSEGDVIPRPLAPRLYHHFSSKNGYALYPDVMPFLGAMRKLKERFRDPNGPIILIGIVSNSDDRTGDILRSLGVRTGHVGGKSIPEGTAERWQQMKAPWLDNSKERRQKSQSSPDRDDFPQFCDGFFNPNDDVDFVVTSYEAGYEKPDSKIFAKAHELPKYFLWSRTKQLSPPKGALDITGKGHTIIKGSVDMMSVHVGNDYEKDYLGVKASGSKGFLLCRNLGSEQKQVYQITNLMELATYVNLLADVNLSPE